MSKSPKSCLARQVGEDVQVYIAAADTWEEGKVMDNHAKYKVRLKTGEVVTVPGRQVKVRQFWQENKTICKPH